MGNGNMHEGDYPDGDFDINDKEAMLAYNQSVMAKSSSEMTQKSASAGSPSTATATATGAESAAKTSEEKTEPQPWGKLASLNDELADFLLTEHKTVIGRHRDCTLRLQGPLISGKHCTITRKQFDGGENIECYYLLDTSSNGTFLNGDVIGRDNQRRINEGAKISFPWRPTEKSAEKIPDKLIEFEFRKVTVERGEEWDEISEQYKIGKELGSGAFAVVRKATNNKTSKVYAIKIVDKKKMSLVQTDRAVKDVLMTEVELLQKLDHPNILKIHEVFDTKPTLFMVLEYVNGGDLYDTLKAAGRLPEHVARPIFSQLLSAIDYMHTMNVSHRDLKPENVLVQKSSNGDIQVKLSDFGLSRATKTDQTLMQTMAGTLDYCAPEIIQHYHTGKGYGREVDMWSLGVILYIMLSGIAPFGQGQQAKQLLNDIIQANFKFPERRFGDVSDDAKDLISMLLVPDPHVRWSAAKAMKHEWVIAAKKE